MRMRRLGKLNKCPKCEGELYLCGANHGDGLVSVSADRYHCHQSSIHNFTIEQLEANHIKVGATEISYDEELHSTSVKKRP